MYLQSLQLTNFKNIPSATLEFTHGINCLVGQNGMGKSNLLDAIYYLSFCRSFSSVPDSMLIRRGEDFAIARAVYQRAGMDEEITLGLAANRRKSLKRSGKEYPRLADHIGRFPAVMVAPEDVDLIRGPGAERRRWMDMVISQTSRTYLDTLIRYNTTLEQRNRLLHNGCVDHNVYQAIETVLAMAASQIHMSRRQWVQQLTALSQEYYDSISGRTDEPISLTLSADMTDTDGQLQPLLDQARRHDEIVRHTSVGPHRDDILITLSGMPMRRTGSQGQCKTLTLALRLAQYHFLRQTTGLKPILLLDDIFDKLDASRVERIIRLVTTHPHFGQIFVTDTNRTHIDHIVQQASTAPQRMWQVHNGQFTPLQ